MDKMKLLPLFLLITLCLSQTFSGVKGRGGRSITEDEDLELERQLKIINKPANITIQTDIGDVYACVDIHQQPALDHPMLKNHKVQLKPSFPKEFDKKPSTNIYKKAIIEQVDCPEGTVPIKRVGKEELRAAKYFSESLRSRLNDIRPQASKYPGLYQAVTKITNGVYRGARAEISVEKLDIAANHYSASHVWVTDDPDGYRNCLWAGWMVSPSMYNDKGATRFFIHWSTNGDTGCFNTYCSGFVVTSKSIVPAAPFRTVSGAEKYAVDITITQDEDGTGHWWLHADSKAVGYWPKGLIPALDDGASHLIWGGVTYGSPSEKSSPMGNGKLPDTAEPIKSGVFKSIGIYVTPGFIDAPVDQSNIKVDCNANYGVVYIDDATTAMAYGGPGGTCS